MAAGWLLLHVGEEWICARDGGSSGATLIYVCLRVERGKSKGQCARDAQTRREGQSEKRGTGRWRRICESRNVNYLTDAERRRRGGDGGIRRVEQGEEEVEVPAWVCEYAEQLSR